MDFMNAEDLDLLEPTTSASALGRLAVRRAQPKQQKTSGGAPAVTTHVMNVSDFTDRVTDLDRESTRAQGVDLLYFGVDEQLSSGRFALVDRMIDALNACELSPQLRIAVLTITGPARSKLTSRKAFAESTTNQLRHLGRDPDRVLHGLI
jgi:hypothetical protein